jgi:hypothetical protein
VWQTGFVVALALLSPMVGWAGDSVGFQTAVSYPVGHNPQGVAAADFNGDGNQDVVVMNSGDAASGDNGGISILLGNGDGTLQGANNIAVGKNPVFVAVGDLNGDGKIDLLVASPGDMTASPPQPGTISVLLGSGDGTFQPGTIYSLMGQLYSLALADFDSNTHLDFVLLWTPSGGQLTLTMWPGNGDGTFQQGANLTLSAPISISNREGNGTTVPIVADFNGDHIPDLAERVALPTLTNQAYIDVLLGKGDGTFQAPLTTPSECYGTVAFGDVNGDGRTDIVDAGNCPIAPTFAVEVLLGNGDGTFRVGAGVPIYASSTELLNDLADLNGDGFSDLVGFDLVSSGGRSSDLLVNQGNGDGSFQWTLGFSAANPEANISVTGLALADLNNDKAPDLVASNNDNTVAVLLNDPGPDFTISATPPTPATVTAGQSATSVVTITMLGAYHHGSFLSCSVQPGTPNPPTCSLAYSGVSLKPGDVIRIDPGQSANVTLTIQTAPVAQAELRARASRTLWLAWLLVAAFAPVGAFQLKGDSRKKLFAIAVVGVLMFCLLPHLACGGGNNAGGKSGGTAYTIVVTDSAAWSNGPAGLQHSTNVTLTVQ